MPPNALTKDELEALNYFVQAPILHSEEEEELHSMAVTALAKLRQPSAPMDFVKILATCQVGLDRWKSKPHNANWWKRIDGTPIPNDLLVCIANELWPLFTHPAPKLAFDEAKEREAFKHVYPWPSDLSTERWYILLEGWLARAKQDGQT